MHPMRVRAIVGVLVAGALVATAPAAARERFRTIGFKTSGSLKVLWHGDPARGCAGAGLCGYSGSIAYPSRPKAFISWFTGGDFEESTGFLDMSRTPTRVRVTRELPGQAPATCTASRRFTAFTLDLPNAYRGRVWLGLGTQIFPGPIVTGQCAGPLLSDVSPSLPSTAVRLRRLARRGARVSLAGRFRFQRGPLSGVVVSTIRMRSRGAHEEKSGPLGRGHPDRHRRLFVEMAFKVERAQGEVRSDFRALDAPICRLRDACGTHGSEVYSFAREGGSVEVFGTARTSARHAPSLRRAIRIGDAGRSSALSTNVLVRPGGARCTDRLRPGETYFVLGGRKRLRAELISNDTVLDGRCPGPTEEQSLHGSRLARGRFALSLLARRSPTLVLGARRDFRAGAFRGRHTAHVELRLRRTRARVSVASPHSDGSFQARGFSARSAL
jgi:hypothetical protein